MNKIKIKVITHEKVVFEDVVDEILTQGIDGKFGILPNHIAITSALDIGVTKVVKDGKSIFMTTMGGILQFKDNTATILTDAAELGSDIDLQRAHVAKEQAEARLKAHDKPEDLSKAQIALAKAIARIKACNNCEL
ncbi:MAG: ATP synthase F1 subunit epsilon [Cyanobacteria bacterium SIG30]|nr:ATP synthase F1 subunit epsilon [Cyanobacteria bacterium SIG30]